MCRARITRPAILGQRGRIPTVQGSYIRANGQGHGVVLNHSATVTTADVMASNGVVHIIDAVLLPS
ncbi:fasciclin domain-containing protein [Nioella aestuarii]|uniref:fasciclin domain-containing protein n=1 Tax=Nioella aestuarii TaxID=1662864 RepID=UPI003D7FA4CA